MDQVVILNMQAQPSGQRSGKLVKLGLPGKIPERHPILDHGYTKGHVETPGAVIIGGGHMDFQSCPGQPVHQDSEHHAGTAVYRSD